MQVCAHAETLVLLDKNTFMLQCMCAALKSSPYFFKMLLVNLQEQLNMSVTQVLSSKQYNDILRQISCTVHLWSWIWYKLGYEAGCSSIPILLKCELHVNSNRACSILIGLLLLWPLLLLWLT